MTFWLCAPTITSNKNNEKNKVYCWSPIDIAEVHVVASPRVRIDQTYIWAIQIMQNFFGLSIVLSGHSSFNCL